MDNARIKFVTVILTPSEGKVEESIEGSNKMSAGLGKRFAYGSFTRAGLGFRMTGLWVGGIASQSLSRVRRGAPTSQ